ncbi:tetratricopeptide repeat protein [Comamonas guangdongensis]|uniref:protein O-GlcNAc transferase n=1 Tax=Comamonas guangdongensis TaxID=510515 RepID=A0ABV3ZT68_9BURK
MTDTTHLQQALEWHEQWEYEAARQAYVQALEQEPGNAQALYGMGLLLGQHMLRSADALPYLEAAIGANPRVFIYWRTYINMLIREGLLDMADMLIGMARKQGMPEISLEQLKKDLALARGEEASVFLETQAALLPELDPVNPGLQPAQPALPPGPVQALTKLLQQRQFGPASEKLAVLQRQYPRSVLLWHARINLEQERGCPADALTAAAKAVQQLPGDVSLWMLQGELLLEGGQPSQAEPALRAALTLQPDLVKLYWLMGDALTAQGKVQQAYPWYVHALLRAGDENDQAQALLALAKALHGEKERQIAAQLLVLLMQQATGVRMCMVCGYWLHVFGWHLQAEMAYRMALLIEPDSQDALTSLAVVLRQDGTRLSEGAACLRRVLAQDLEPKLRASVLHDLAHALLQQKQWEQCDAVLDELLAEDAAALRTHRLRCVMLLERGDLDKLAQALEQGLAHHPGEHDLIYAKALYWGKRGDVQQAMAHYDELLARYPDSTGGHSARLHIMMHSPYTDPVQMGDACKAYGELKQRRHGGADVTEHANARIPDKVLRVGFVSADLRGHAAAKFFLPVMRELSQRQDMECIAYCNNPTYDEVSAQFMKLFAQWRNVKDMTAQAVVSLVQEDGIDILFDLSGHTSGHRLDVFARRAAPLQLTWIGNPGSTGLQTMDYMVLSDLLLDGHAVRQQLTEHMLRLPLAYVFEGGIHAEPVAPLPALRNGYLTFGSFNRLVKVNREVVAVWAQVLRSVPDARMAIGACEDSGPPPHLREWLQEEGIDEQRLRFIPRTDFLGYMKAHADIDICLDTFPFTGGVVTNHALWMGVPTLTLVGDLLCGRQSAEVLARVGLTADFAARDLPELLRLARHWSGNLEQLSVIRQALRPVLQAQESGQAGMVSQALALGLRQAWARWCAGEAAADLHVSYEDLGLTPPERIVLPRSEMETQDQ